ncbi:sugar transferase [Histidinibacterium lentulum]|uniref:Sugar transferase n=1 Tax=Histidinibacterium lentulum TaxID=2480588 RepID=A0A3N2QSE9_9RHOB|nr:sugar transferase [Histidinibacterium lentulum]
MSDIDASFRDDFSAVSSSSFRGFRHGCSVTGRAYPYIRRGADIVGSAVLAPVVGVVALALLALNPFWNPGPLFFRQPRMGRGCLPFMALKFRTMRPAEAVTRAADDPLEEDRITPLGRVLRKMRLDELPQVLNVLAGEMSLIGPRPDFYDHAVTYLASIPRYRQRHMIRPGISGLAQTEVGYVSSIRETRRKVSADLYYIQHASLRMDAWIVWRTLKVVLTRAGT